MHCPMQARLRLDEGGEATFHRRAPKAATKEANQNALNRAAARQNAQLAV